jgi:hypothetical protein
MRHHFRWRPLFVLPSSSAASNGRIEVCPVIRHDGLLLQTLIFGGLHLVVDHSKVDDAVVRCCCVRPCSVFRFV